MKYLILLGVLQFLGQVLAQRQCTDDELTTVMTECNAETNEKYRFTVPTVPNCKAPGDYFGIACDKTCEPGYYLDLKGDHECHKCNPGTYSLGSGAKITYWPESDSEGAAAALPLGFVIDNTYISYTSSSCNMSSWTPRGDYIVSNADHCFIRLMYVADLKIPGYVEFEYRYTDPGIHFHFYVVDENCHEPRESSVYPKTTGHDEWRKIKVELGTGVNKLYWRTYTVTYGENATSAATGRLKPVLLKSVYINGVAYSTECTKCPAGFFQSEQGASTCDPCTPNSYAPTEGSVTCSNCNAASEYSLYAAEKCETRPMCTEKDYYKFHGPCVDGKTKETYEWIKPKICRGDMQGAVQLPASNHVRKCPLCNPGMYKEKPAANCTFCPEGEYSNGTAPCVKCPGKHKAVPAYVFDFWDGVPPNTEMYCYSVSGMGCPEDSIGWSFSNDAVVSNLGNADDTIAMMEVFVKKGFSKMPQHIMGKMLPVGMVEFVFEMKCPDSDGCTLFFGQAKDVHSHHKVGKLDDGEDFVTVNVWEGSTAKTVYKHEVASNSPQSFLWAFQKTAHPEMEEASHDHIKSHLKIHSIKITGTVEGGASECISCGSKSDSDDSNDWLSRSGKDMECEPCPPGKFYAPPLDKCMKCPTTQDVIDHFGLERLTQDIPVNPATRQSLLESQRKLIEHDFIVNPLGNSDDKYCLKCGPGLTSPEGVTCRSNCKFTMPDGRKLDLSMLNKGTVTLKTKPVFTDSGFESFKLYNFSLCGDFKTGRGLAYCSANVSRVSHDDDAKADNETDGGVEDEYEKSSRKYGFVCRSDLFPPRGDELKEAVTEYPLDNETDGGVEDEYEKSSRKYGFVCRSDLFPPRGDELKEAVTEYPLVLGEELVAVTLNRSYMNWTIKTTDVNKETHDINFYYISFQPTYACPKGRSVILTLRCDPFASEEVENQVQVNASDPEGTDDGCEYNFLRISKYACPECDQLYDMDEIVGECHFGQQKIRYTWKNDKRVCRDGELPKSITRKCTFFTKEVQIATAVAILVVLILAVISSYYWRKTQRLEYKYQKLVQSSTKDGTTQFAEAPSCGLSEDEEEDDDELNNFGNDKKSILGKLRLKNGKAHFKDQGSDDEAQVRLSTGGRYSDEMENASSRI